MTDYQPSGIFEYVKSLFIALVLALIIKTTVIEAYKIPSSSMEDTLLIGDFLLANKFIYGAQIPYMGWRLPAIRQPKQGDVVIFRVPTDRKTNYIKRCVATEGQVVEIKNKVLYVDGEVFPNPEHAKFTDHRIIPFGPESRRDNMAKYRVPKGNIYCMGDNRDNSYDSRYWGPVPLDLIEGKALIIHWSWTPDENAPQIRLDDLSTIPSSVIYNIAHFFQLVRWSRLGTIID